MNSYILDTNICIYIINQSPQNVLKKFHELDYRQISISIITYGELFYGISKGNNFAKSKISLDKFTQNIHIIPIDSNVAKHYGDIRAKLSKQGDIIGNNDLWIVAHARSLDATLVSNNLKDFERVQGLKTENWVG